MDGAAEIRVLSPTAILGYGFPEASFAAGLARDPHVIAVDAGSSDPGPYYLGAGVSFTDREAVKRDLRLMLRAGRERRVPVVVGTAGGAGAGPHLAWTRAIIEEIAAEEGLAFRMAVVGAEVEKATLLRALEAGRLSPMPHGDPLTPEDVRACTHVVAQMGVEPFVNALEAGAEVVLAGRAYDPAVFAAVPILAGFDPGLALHMGKILECAAIAAAPGSGSDCMLGTLRRDHFLVEPLSPGAALHRHLGRGPHALREERPLPAQRAGRPARPHRRRLRAGWRARGAGGRHPLRARPPPTR